MGFMLRRNQYFLMALRQLKEVRYVAMFGGSKFCIFGNDKERGFPWIYEVDILPSLIWDSWRIVGWRCHVTSG